MLIVKKRSNKDVVCGRYHRERRYLFSDLKNMTPLKHNSPLTVFSGSSTGFTMNIKAFLRFEKNVTQRIIFTWWNFNYSTIFERQLRINEAQ